MRAGARRILAGVLAGAALVLASGGPLGGGSVHAAEGLLNRLLAPGPLIKGHADLESDCLKCHDVGKGIAASKCMDCHKEIGADVKAKTGYHGLMTQTCVECHAEHKGRENDTIKVDAKTFDHKLTGFDLTGKHAQIDCQKCHTEKRGAKSIHPGEIRFLGQKAKSCASCHKKDDIHHFKGTYAGKDCNACHNELSWKEGVKFNHEIDGHFKLVQKHAQLKCQDCHNPNKKDRKASIYHWENLKSAQCLACHQEVHRNHLSAKFAGPKCEACHNQTTFKIVNFQHEKITGYSILGAHAKLTCTECHKQTPEAMRQGKSAYHWKGEGTSCASCHKDPHRENLSPKFRGRCDGCHGMTTWKITNFPHQETTGYAITGGHVKLQCTDCHKQSRSALSAGPKSFHWTGLGTKCASCHEDPHKNNLSPKFRGQCETCHGDTAWKIAKFDHAKITRYELRGKHAQLDCTKCHTQSERLVAQGPTAAKYYHWTGLKTQCLDCHKDTHRFGAWRSAKFKSPNACTECHDESAWKPAHFNHTDDTRFSIDGKHVGLKCDDCHVEKDKNKKPLRVTYHWDQLKKKNCEICHANPHVASPNKQFKLKRCDECHLTVGWLQLANGKNFDHKATRFPLTGRHQSLTCKACHEVKGKQVFRWETADQKFCISCHQNVHVGQFNANFSDRTCAACHDTTDFRNRLPFNHEEARFQLRFKHKEVKCEKCHVATDKVFSTQALPDRLAKAPAASNRMHKFMFPEMGAKGCASCHQDAHHGNFGGACADCHNEQTWKKTNDFHKNFTLTGVHFTLECAECHKNDRKLAGMSQNCVLCHQKDDIHQGTLPNCGECHKQQFWENVDFKHSLTLFPLLGFHRTIDCAACHNRGIYRGTPNQCSDCHLSTYVPATLAPLAGIPPSVPAHSSFPNLTRCADCHNQFQF